MTQKFFKILNMSAFWQNTLVFLLYAGIGLIIYQNSFGTPFIYDDTDNISENQAIRLQTLSLAALKKSVFESHSLSRPVANVSFALNYYFNQYRVWGYHATNLAIHILTGFFLFLLFKRTLQLYQRLSLPAQPSERISGVAAFAALLWLTHPMQTQSVTYIVQRMNSMAGMFFVASLLLYGYARSAKSPFARVLLWGGVLMTALFAIGTKLNTVTLPFFILLYEWFFYRNLDRTWGKKYFGIFIGGVIVLAGVFLFICSINPLKAILSTYQGYTFSPLQRVMTEFRVVLFYLSQLALPYPGRLNLDHDFPLSHSFMDPPTTIFSLIAILLVLGMAVWQAQRARLMAFAMIWYLGNLVIESSIIGLELIYDHRVYLPSMFLFLAVVHMGAKHIKSSKVAILCGGMTVLLLAFWTHARNQDWKNGITIWTDAMQKSPQKARPYNNLGVLWSQKGAFEASLAYYRKALTLDPDYPEAYNNLGYSLSEMGELQAAQAQFQKAIALNPGNAEAHNNLGTVLSKLGAYDDAIGHFNSALNIRPDYYEARNNLGFARAGNGDNPAAKAEYLKALSMNPAYVDAHMNLGILLSREKHYAAAVDHFTAALNTRQDARTHRYLGKALGDLKKYQQATDHFETSLKLDPNDAETHYQFGKLIAAQGRMTAAIPHFERAVALAPENAEYHNNLGVALAQANKVEKAIHHFEAALKIRPDYPVARKNLAQLQKHAGVKNAIETLEAQLRQDPDSFRLHLKLGNLYKKKNLPEKAVIQYREAIAIKPDNAMAHFNLGAALSDLDKYAEAMHHYDKTVALNPAYHQYVAYNKACIHARENQPKETIAWLEKAKQKGFRDWEAVDTDPSFDTLRPNLAFKTFIESQKQSAALGKEHLENSAH